MGRFTCHGSDPSAPPFEFPELCDFVEDMRRRLQQPLTLPDYAAAGEGEMVQKVSDVIAENPYRLRAAISEYAGRMGENFQAGTLRPVRYQEYPKLYRAAQFTMEAAARSFADLDVMIQIYRAAQTGDIYQAKALSYLNKAWLFISEHFFMQPNAGMLRDGEVCFLLGHELGHAQCRHSSIELLTGTSLCSDIEYSADRGGLIICAQWLLRERPQEDRQELLRQAVLCGVAALDKLGLAYRGYYQWQSYDYDELGRRIQGWRDNPGALPPDLATHPCDARRALALHHFSQSELLYRCLGLEPVHGLHTDDQLQDVMNMLLKK